MLLCQRMGLGAIPKDLSVRYKFQEWNHATAILRGDFQNEWKDLIGCLAGFFLRKSAIVIGGKGRSEVSIELDGYLTARGWSDKHFDIAITVDGAPIKIPTHKIDNFKNKVGIEVEWNNKTEFYDRDLNNFRLLHQLGVLSVGVIITRASELQSIFNELGIGKKYGKSTTHWDKLVPKVNG